MGGQFSLEGFTKDTQESSMPFVIIIYTWTCFAGFWKLGTDGLTNDTCENSNRDCGWAEWINKLYFWANVILAFFIVNHQPIL